MKEKLKALWKNLTNAKLIFELRERIKHLENMQRYSDKQETKTNAKLAHMSARVAVLTTTLKACIAHRGQSPNRIYIPYETYDECHRNDQWKLGMVRGEKGIQLTLARKTRKVKVRRPR